MIKKIKGFIEKWNMITPGDRVFIGVSGGADSVCLCLILAALSEQMDFTPEVIHVEHGIRGEESLRDARFVQTLCDKLGLVCHVVSVGVPAYAKEHHMGEEEAARILRYREFAQMAAAFPGAKIALAHHMEDNAETILLQLIRGSGLDGLCGMRPLRAGSGGEVYIRPLLNVGRREIEAFLAEQGQVFCEDSTNADLSYSRNRIRHKILPELEEINSQAVHHMNRTAELLGELRGYMDAQADSCEAQVMRREKGKVVLSVEELTALPQALRMRMLHRAVSEAAGRKKDIAGVHLEAVEQLAFKQTGRRVDLPYGLVAERAYGEIVLAPAKETALDGTDCSVSVSPEQLRAWKHAGEKETFSIPLGEGCLICRIFSFDGNIGKIPRKRCTKWFDYDKIKDGFTIRTRKAKDFFLLDEAGHRKKLADYFVDEKIPAAQRNQRLLLAQKSKVLWIVEGRMGYGVGITEHTHTVFAVTYQGGKNHGL